MIIICLVFRRCILYRPPATTLPVFSRALRGEVHTHASWVHSTHTGLTAPPVLAAGPLGTRTVLKIHLLPG